MLSIAHAATGAYLASKISNPLLAIPAILVSHYLADAVAHWDAGTGLGKGLKSPQTAFYHELIDLTIAGIVVLLFYYQEFPLVPNLLPLSGTSVRELSPYWGAFIALMPDLLEAPRNFLKYEPRWLRGINKFHSLFHHSIPRILDGLAPQLLLLVILYLTK